MYVANEMSNKVFTIQKKCLLNFTSCYSLVQGSAPCFFRDSYQISIDDLHKAVEQSGAAEACWAHNPEVLGSKPSSARSIFF